MPVNQRPLGLTRSVSPGYFRTLGIPLLSGRDFTEHDKLDSRLVVILSNSTAKKLFSERESTRPIKFFFGTDNGNGLPAEVIGVVGDVRSQELPKRTMSNFTGRGRNAAVRFSTSSCAARPSPKQPPAIVAAALKKIDKACRSPTKYT